MKTYGIVNTNHPVFPEDGQKDQYWNLSPAELVEMAVKNNEGILSKYGCFCVKTGKYTGRSAKDKYTVVYPDIEDKIWYGEANNRISIQEADKIFEQVKNYLKEKKLFIRDCYAVADKENRLIVRAITETAWHNLFASSMFIMPNPKKVTKLVPNFTIYHAPSLKLDPSKYGLRSEAFVIIDLKKHVIMIGGTSYAGEMKKSVFSILNYILPQKNIITMHCSANIGKKNDVAIFFGLSGTGKTTLSSEKERILIGDDEHGWSDKGIFNLEGGCYAKMIRLSSRAEPEIYATTRKFGTILENVILDDDSRDIDFDDDSITENTRGAYPLTHLDNIFLGGRARHASTIIMLTADAFGVLPLISKLTEGQAMYHFISGYTAKLAGTELGIIKPVATFSACFGGPFMLLKPMAYAKLLKEKIKDHDAKVFLVNTGWIRGPYGVGHRINIRDTRTIIHSILDGTLKRVEWTKEPYFNLQIPLTCPSVDPVILDPIQSWADKEKYKESAENLKKAFRENFKSYEAEVSDEVKDAAI